MSSKLMLAFGGAFAAAALVAADADAKGRPDLVLKALQSGKAKFVAGEMIVKYKDGAADGEVLSVRTRIGARLREKIAHRGRGAMEVVSLPPGLSMAAAVARLSADDAVEYAEPNWIYTIDATSNDPQYTNGSLWGMYGDASSPANQFGSQAAEAWAANKTNCGSVYVGIIDEGYMYTHEDLAPNAAVNPGEVAGNGRDDDGNGLVDDVYGWDFDGNNNSIFDGAGDDHGTHVAGTIGAVGGNGRGVAGVCWSVKLMNAKFLGSNGGTTANAIKAVDYFTSLKTRQNLNIVATSNSWGGGGFSQALQDAIERANAAGVLFIVAAGNSTLDCDTSSACYPAEYPNANVISVASITSTGGLSSFSNYGATTIDIGAPGSGIWSTVPVRQGRRTVAGYASYSGTSMATPHVSGAAALYKALNPGATAAQVKAAILNSAVPTPSLQGKTLTGGRLNVGAF